jgi:hypothetical protein
MPADSHATSSSPVTLVKSSTATDPSSAGEAAAGAAGAAWTVSTGATKR